MQNQFSTKIEVEAEGRDDGESKKKRFSEERDLNIHSRGEYCSRLIYGERVSEELIVARCL